MVQDKLRIKSKILIITESDICMDLPFMTVGIAVLMAFPVLRLLYMDQQFENYLVKIKLARDKSFENDQIETLDTCKQLWDKLLSISERNRSSIKYDFAAVLTILVIGWLTVSGVIDDLEWCCVNTTIFYLILGMIIGVLLGRFMQAFSNLNKIKMDVNKMIFEI